MGSFELSATIDRDTVKANEGLTLRILLEGTGNIGLFSLPENNFPEYLEVFPPTENFEKDAFRNQISGKQLWEYVLIPRKEGPLVIPGMKMSIFDSNKKTSIREILGLDALAMLKDRSFLFFFVASILICIPLAFYYQHANQFLNEVGMKAAASKMTLGQISEVLFLLLLPLFIKRYGIKSALIIGILAWGIRYLLFAFGDTGEQTWMLLFGIILHGVCYDFFFVSGQIYTDFKAGETYKSTAQGLITLATYGVGMLIGFRFAGWLTDQYITDLGHLWKEIWIQPAIFSFVVLILFLIFFKNETIKIKSL